VIRRETGSIVAELLGGPEVEKELSRLVVATLQSGPVKDELDALQLKVALWAAGGVALGIVAGLWAWRRF
jgi:hypothetical protein